MLKQLTLFLLFLLAVSTSIYAQTPTFSGEYLSHWDQKQSGSARTSSLPEMADALKVYDRYALDVQAVRKYVTEHPGPDRFLLSLGRQYQWDITVEENSLLSPDYQSYTLTPEGKQLTPTSSTVTYKGKLNDPAGGEVRLLIDGDHLEGFVTYRGQRMYLENINSTNARSNTSEVIVYPESAVTQNGKMMCLAKETDAYDKEMTQRAHNARVADVCPSEACPDKTGLRIATFALYSRTAAAGGAQRVNNEILGILNNVQSLFDRFDLKFNVVEQVASTSAGSDPWKHQNIGTSLDKFRDWTSSGFDKERDENICFVKATGNDNAGMATRSWSFNASGIISVTRHVVVNKMGSAVANKALVAHEIAHNLDAQHDSEGSSFIMGPVLNLNDPATEWSDKSKSAITDYISSRNCLACVSDDGPDTPTAGCDAPGNLKITNLQPTTVTLNWQDSPGTKNYTVQIKRKDRNSWYTLNTGRNFVNITKASPGTTYQWRIRSNCSENQSNFVNASAFTTLPNRTLDDPVADCRIPTNYIIKDLTYTAANFSWNATSSAQSYTFQVREKGDARWQSFTTRQTAIRIRGMNSGTTHQWRLRSNCSDGKSNFIPIQDFTTFSPQDKLAARSDKSTLSAEELDASLSLAESEQGKLEVSPNPYGDSFRLRLPDGDAQQAEVKVFNLNGQLMREGKYQLGDRGVELGQGLLPGAYTIRVVAADQLRYEAKVIKK